VRVKGILTEKQEKFVQELLKGKTQREAYYIAYPKSKKWKPSAVDTQASILLSKEKVLERYQELNRKVIERAEQKSIVTAEKIIQELANIAFSNATDIASIIEKQGERKVRDEDGEIIGTEKYKYYVVEPKPTADLAEDKKAAIAELKETRYGIGIKQHDKLKALELLGKHLKLFDGEEDSKTINLIHSIPRPTDTEEE
jgi:phage terminase small subunit